MLVLSRKIGEKVVIGDSIVVTINRITGNRVTIGIEAPHDQRVMRGELIERDAARIPAPEHDPTPAQGFVGAGL